MDICHSAFFSSLKSFERDGLSSDGYMFLSTLFGESAVKSLKDVLSKEQITLNISKFSGRELWTITSSKNTHYIWINGCRFGCSCKSFYYSTIKDGKTPFCKHILAAYVCSALKSFSNDHVFQICELDNEEFQILLEKSANTIDLGYEKS